MSETLHDGIVGTFLGCAHSASDLSKGVKAEHAGHNSTAGVGPTIFKALRYKNGSTTLAYALGLQEKMNDAAASRGDPHITEFNLNC